MADGARHDTNKGRQIAAAPVASRATCRRLRVGTAVKYAIPHNRPHSVVLITLQPVDSVCQLQCKHYNYHKFISDGWN